MRLASFEYRGLASFGAVTKSGIIDLRARLEGRCSNLRAFLADDNAREVGRLVDDGEVDYAPEDVEWLPVIPNPSQILCVGLNYRAHAAEVGRPLDKYPVIFLRTPASQTGHLMPIVRPRMSEALDYEGEVAVIIGKSGRYIAQADALRHVAGYSIYNDASLRDWQRHTHQYTPGKNFPATGAFGPWMTTADEIPDPAELEISTRLNGETVQHAKLTDLIFSIPEIIAYLSSFTVLKPGDTILTGTPAGVGSMRKPPLWLKPGDCVEVEVSKIGVLRNSVVQEA